MTALEARMTAPPVPTPPPAAPGAPASTAPPATPPVTPPAPVQTPPVAPAAPLHEDPAIAKALEGLTEEQRATLLTTGGKNALDARAEEAKTAKAAAKAAETARAELVQSLGKALGLVDEAPDAAKLAEQLTAQTNAAKTAQTELAVLTAAVPTLGANASRLLDSRSFMAKVAALDPADAAGIATAVTEAVTADPTLIPATGPRLPAPSPAPGSSAGGAPDNEAVKADAIKRGDWQTAFAIENQKLVTAPKP